MTKRKIRTSYAFHGGSEAEQVCEFLSGPGNAAGRKRVAALLGWMRQSSQSKDEYVRWQLLNKISDRVRSYRRFLDFNLRVRPDDRFSPTPWVITGGPEQRAVQAVVDLYVAGLEWRVQRCDGDGCARWFVLWRKAIGVRQCLPCRQKARRSTPRWRQRNAKYQRDFWERQKRSTRK